RSPAPVQTYATVPTMGHDTNATVAGAAADALERLVRARMDAEIRGLHVPELIPTCSRRWRRRSCRSRCLGARWRTRSTPRLLWWPGSACGGLVEDTPERLPQGFPATESHIKTVAWHLAPMIKGTGGRADASGFTRLSKKGSANGSQNHVLNEKKNCADRPQKRTFPDATRSERCIGWWVIFGRILNQPLLGT